MKKLLVILMLVAMASFLFVGCLPSVTPDEEEVVEEEEEEEEEVVEAAQTDTPYITGAGFSILSTTTVYVLTSGAVSVNGVGVAGAIIKLYIDDVYAGIGSTGTDGSFSGIGITGITLAEGARKLYVTATVPGLAESDKSTEYEFTYDKTKPTVVSVAGDSSSRYITVTFSEAVQSTTVVATTWTYTAGTAYDSIPDNTVLSVAVPSTTTARLSEHTADALSATNNMLISVAFDAKVKDLAGNLILATTIYGTLVK